jgi:hypothetical protein
MDEPREKAISVAQWTKVHPTVDALCSSDRGWEISEFVSPTM